MSGPHAFSAIRYSGAGPGNGVTVTLFATVDTSAGVANVGYWAKHLTSEMGIHRCIFNVQTTDNTGSSFVLQKSPDRGVTWYTVSTTAVSGTTTNNTFDVVVEGLPDWRVRWVNGATPQAVFEADGAFIDTRPATT